jgi:hypothetical protein
LAPPRDLPTSPGPRRSFVFARSVGLVARGVRPTLLFASPARDERALCDAARVLVDARFPPPRAVVDLPRVPPRRFVPALFAIS